MYRGILLASLGTVLSFLQISASGQPLEPGGTVEFGGELAEPEQLSGLAFVNDFLVICPDEGVYFNVLKLAGADRYALHSKVGLLDDEDEEIDMEAATTDGEFVFIAGSHSMHRKTVDADRTYKKNRSRLLELEPHEKSYSVFRIKLDQAGRLSSRKKISLRDVLKDDDFLGPFCKLPSKENGVDIEGLAIKDGKLYVGFRGPVLRGNFVPVMTLKFDEPSDYELSFVDLAGRGIRDITATKDGFLLIAGPVGDGDMSFQLYFWNGKDCIPGEGGPEGVIRKVGELPKMDAKPEGLVVTSETPDAWHVILLCDGKRGGMKFVIRKL